MNRPRITPRTLRRAAVAASAAALTAPAVLVAGPATALPAYTTEPTTYTNTRVTGHPLIVDMRVAQHRSFDRVVIDVDGRRPSFQASYVTELRYDGSGKRVPLEGARSLSLRISPARAHDASGSVYEGPRLRQYSLPTLRGVAFTGDFEGVVSFGFTTDRRAPYRAFTLTDPSRIVLDFKH